MSKSKVMWAVLHTPSQSWDNGHANLTLYWARYEALIACGKSGGWEPIRVVVTESPEPQEAEPRCD